MKPVIAALLLACSARAEVLFHDPFHEKLAPGWSWVRENPAAWKIGGGYLQIRIEPGNMWGGENSGKNILVRDLPETDGALEVSMTVENRPTSQYEQVDLVSYFDDSNMVKIGQELVDGQLSIVMGREEADRTRTIVIIPLQTARVELRQIIERGRVTGLFRPHGEKEWRVAGACDLPKNARPRIAIQCYQGPKDQEHWAKIAEFKIEAKETAPTLKNR